MTDVPHFVMPFRFRYTGGTRVEAAVAEQDSLDDIFSCVEVVARYTKGERLAQLDFGISDQTFSETDIDLDQVMAEIMEWEPRANLPVDATAQEHLIKVLKEVRFPESPILPVEE